jgi:hypothetical protein
VRCLNGHLVRYIRDGNNEPYRNAIWGRRCRSAGCHEARRNNRDHACPLVVGIATDERGWITFAEARILFSSKGAQYAFGETDQDGRKSIESFAAQHRSVINFVPFEERVYFVSGGNTSVD